MSTGLICRCSKTLPSGFSLEAGLSLALDRSPVTILFGPSGSGKTTLLRLLAGLDRPDSGAISFRGQDWFDSARAIDLPPQQRRAAFLFQDYALFPHLSVASNVAFAARPGRARDLLKAFGLAPLAARKPHAISGGEAQRVALARALAAGPNLLLLDEPLSALDQPTRAWMRYELRRMLQEGGVPAIVVTHDRLEAAALGDWIAVMVEGRLRQTGPVQDVFRQPIDALVAAAIGVENVLPARIVSREGGLVTLHVGAVQLQSVDSAAVPSDAMAVCACIPADGVTLTREPPQPSSARNRFVGRVRSVMREGPLARVELDCGFPLVAIITAQSASDLQLRTGDSLSAVVKATSVHLTAAAG